MSKLPRSRILQPSDVAQMSGDLARIVDWKFDTRAPQHNARKVEYTAVLEAIEQITFDSPAKVIVDVGGAGSPLPDMVKEITGIRPLVVDPADDVANYDLTSYLQLNPPLANIVLCVSVIEHVKDEAQFLYELTSLLAPGGWLILTMDFAATQPDTYHFHWMRERIYSSTGMVRVQYGLQEFFQCDPDLHEYTYPFVPLVHDYTFASLCAQKRLKYR